MMEVQFRDILQEAARRFERDLAEMPDTGMRMRRWLGGDINAFALRSLDTTSFPTLALPSWIVGPEGLASMAPLLIDLSHSSLHGFCFIRLIDDVADGDEDPELRRLLPACGFFHHRFQAAYAAHYAATHPFWAAFVRYWDQQAEASAADSHLATVTEDTFQRFSSKKFSAAKIPATAACISSNQEHLAAQWCSLVDDLGAFYQTANDITGYRDDFANGTKTYFLESYRSLLPTNESVEDWFRREGVHRGREYLTHLADKATASAKPLSEYAVAWIESKNASLLRQLGEAGIGSGSFGKRLDRTPPTSIRGDATCLL